MGTKKSAKATVATAVKIWMDERDRLQTLVNSTDKVITCTKAAAKFESGAAAMLEGIRGILEALVSAPTQAPAKPKVKPKELRLRPKLNELLLPKKPLAGVALAKEMAKYPDPNAGAVATNADGKQSIGEKWGLRGPHAKKGGLKTQAPAGGA